MACLRSGTLKFKKMNVIWGSGYSMWRGKSNQKPSPVLVDLLPLDDFTTFSLIRQSSDSRITLGVSWFLISQMLMAICFFSTLLSKFRKVKEASVRDDLRIKLFASFYLHTHLKMYNRSLKVNCSKYSTNFNTILSSPNPLLTHAWQR